MKNIVFFDLETRRSAAEVGGWHQASEMGVSVAVTYSTKNAAYRIYTQEQIDELIEELRAADLVVGFNHIKFDYEVLQKFTFWTVSMVTNNLDLCSDIAGRMGVARAKLEGAAKATLGGLSKTADGLEALKWWRDYEANGDKEQLLRIAEYCCYDVKVTMAVYLYGVEHGHIYYETGKGEIVKVDVDWGA